MTPFVAFLKRFRHLNSGIKGRQLHNLWQLFRLTGLFKAVKISLIPDAIEKLVGYINNLIEFNRRCVFVYVLFNVVIQLQTASQGKPTRHPVFYMLIRTHHIKHSDKPYETMRKNCSFCWELNRIHRDESQ